MGFFTIDTEKCKRDGICVDECPMRILEMSDASSASDASAGSGKILHQVRTLCCSLSPRGFLPCRNED